MPNIIYTISGYLYYYKILTILSINRILIKYRNDVKYNGYFEYCKIKNHVIIKDIINMKFMCPYCDGYDEKEKIIVNVNKRMKIENQLYNAYRDIWKRMYVEKMIVNIDDINGFILRKYNNLRRLKINLKSELEKYKEMISFIGTRYLEIEYMNDKKMDEFTLYNEKISNIIIKSKYGYERININSNRLKMIQINDSNSECMLDMTKISLPKSIRELRLYYPSETLINSLSLYDKLKYLHIELNSIYTQKMMEKLCKILPASLKVLIITTNTQYISWTISGIIPYGIKILGLPKQYPVGCIRNIPKSINRIILWG